MHQRVAVALGQQRHRALRREALEGGVAMAAGDLHVGDQRVLAVVVLDHVGVARAQAALGAGGEPRAQRGGGAAGAREAGDHVVLARGQVGNLGLVEHRDAGRVYRLAQGRGERAGGGDVAERRAARASAASISVRPSPP